MKKKVLLLILGIILFIMPIFSWSAHAEMTQIILENFPWLDKYNNIPVTPYTYNDPSPYNPNYVIPYRGEKIGEKISAKTIITRYVTEPDNGMDENLNLSSMQKLMGGSSGWRHMYFITFQGALKLGEAPKRIIHFWNLAREAFQKGDYYWGFRFFAYSLHYLQDLSMPFHAYPMPLENVVFGIFNLDKLIMQGENHHYTLEDYQEYQIKSGNPKYIKVLKEAKPLEITNPEEAGVKAAWLSRRFMGKLWDLQIKYYGDDINKVKNFKADPKFFKDYVSPIRDEYDSVILQALELCAGWTKGYVNYLENFLNKLEGAK
ncbi:MAG: hypothetical protein CBR30_05785 [Dictyoglomus sp. NZ13-RE01]|nr:MAG: hypothetical protein CBR30_05785 [Dictyoglomus sp. NZ13-RE01]